MATHSSTLAWKIPWAEQPGGLQSMGLHLVAVFFIAKSCLTLCHPMDCGLPVSSVHGIS